jgi:hypothetical protein
MGTPPEGQGTVVRGLVYGRTGFVSLLAAALIGANLSGVPLFPLAPVLTLLAATYLLSAVYLALLGRVGNPVWLAEIQIYGDVVLETFLIYLTGGPFSVFPFLYLVSILTASIVITISALPLSVHSTSDGGPAMRRAVATQGLCMVRRVEADGSRKPPAWRQQRAKERVEVVPDAVVVGVRHRGQFLGQPLRAILRTMQETREGNLRARATLTRRDELGTIATGLNEMLDQLERFNQSLHGRIEEATRDLSLRNAQLAASQGELFALRESLGRAERVAALGQVAANVVHQAGTPLNLVSGYVQMIRDGGELRANAVYGFWPANADGDDLVLYGDAKRGREVARFPMLRQQRPQNENDPCFCLADFVAPLASGAVDSIGAFAVTAGLGADEIAHRFEAELDDYHAIMAKSLADRLAEAFAEWLHARVRREWGYGQSEQLSAEDLIAEKYRGIRPAFGYPACPDHSEKTTLFDLLGASEIGMDLTSGFAMTPPASVSGLYLAHPRARYFSVGKIGRDQVSDYARRKGATVPEIERALAPNLSYEPDPT